MPFKRSDGPVPRLASLDLASPEHVLDQDDVARRAIAMFAPGPSGWDRLSPIYRNAEIATRRSCVPIDWYEQPHSFPERNDLFLQHAVALLAEAADRALTRAGLAAEDIDCLITVCSTGVATPALDARLMEVMPFKRTVQRLPIFGLGCAGGVLGLARAAAMARAEPQSRVLLLVVELCALTFRHADRTKSNLIATALFGDGAAAAVISCRDEYAEAPALGPFGEHTWPDSLDVMGWDVAEDGLKVLFSRDIPTLVREDLGAVVDAFLKDAGATREDIAGYVNHPGGAKVLDALEECFGLPERSLEDARGVLRDFGNMSSVTVLFILRRMLDRGVQGPHLVTSMGPGFTAALGVVTP
jgi:alkylresorcinol/alkylpyrone synthase